jgi:hypothetical protein
MEKIKWIIIGVLAIILIVVIVRQPSVEQESTLDNHVKFTISYSDIDENVKKPKLIQEGEYVLLLDEFQKIEGRGTGWHIRFSKPHADKYMILIIDMVDTTSTIFQSDFPQTIEYSAYADVNSPLNSLHRGSIKVGFSQQKSAGITQEDIIPMLQFACRIDTSYVQDKIGGMTMSFRANHSEMLKAVYGFHYNLEGQFDIHDAPISPRVLQ